MKRLTALLLLISISVTSQAQAPKKASKIILANSNSKAVNLRSAIDILVDNGYMIAKSDTLSGTILTEERSVINDYGKYRIYIIARDNKLTATGQTNGLSFNLMTGKPTSDWEPVENIGMKKSPNARAFQYLEDIASKLPGTKTYE